jgi:hypothetical protein
MLYIYVKGLGFIRYLAVDGTDNPQIFFTHDFEAATKWYNEKDLHNDLNGDIAKRDYTIVRIEEI